uniref:hypothetical protein n=1 Tax=Eubacterium cellulosolvens TaxID=29322 RepID=UPI00047FA4A0|nr:hypothetical protein [[Eubacterium] cellulosolvens]
MIRWNPQKNSSGSVVAFPRPIGFSLLFVVFLILCFFTFAAITLLTAKSDLDSSKTYAERQTAYYAACNRAEEKVASLNRDAAANPDTAALAAHFKEQIDDTQTLHISLLLDDNKYRITRWQVVSETDWTAEMNQDNSLPVLQMNDDGE